MGTPLLGGVATAAGTGATAAAKPRIPGTVLTAGGARQGAAYLGVYRPFGAPGCSRPDALESAIGRRFAINHQFRSPPETEWAPLRDQMLADTLAGRIPMLSYAAGKALGYPDDEAGQRAAALARLVQTARGERDAYIDGQAAALAALNVPTFLRFTWEFDIRYFGEAGAAAHRAAWRHVWSRFQRAGATNVAFVWCPTWLAFQDGTAANFYPGDEYVDWIAADGYSRSPDYRSFTSLFTAANVFAIARGKPFMVAETGVSRLTSQASLTSGRTKQSEWLDQIRRILSEGRFANLKALVYFHTDGDNVPLVNQWRVTVPSPGPALDAFTRLSWHPRLKARTATTRPAAAHPAAAGAGVDVTAIRDRRAV